MRLKGTIISLLLVALIGPFAWTAVINPYIDSINPNFPGILTVNTGTLKTESGSGDFVITQKTNSARIALRARDGASVAKNIIDGAGDGDTTIYYAGNERIKTGVNAEIRLLGQNDLTSDSTGSPLGNLTFYDQNASHLEGFIGYGTSDPSILQIVNRRHGFPIEFWGQDSVGTDKQLIKATPGQTTDLYAAGAPHLIVENNRIHILGESTGSVSTETLPDPSLAFRNSANNSTYGELGFNDGNTNMLLFNSFIGGLVQLKGLATGSIQKVLWEGDPDGGVKMYGNSVPAAYAMARWDSSGTALANLNGVFSNPAGAGTWTLTFNAGVFSGTPICSCMMNGAGQTCYVSGSHSSSLIQFTTADSTPSPADLGGMIMCMSHLP